MKVKSSLNEILEVLAEEKKIDIEGARDEALRLYFNLRPELKLEGAVICYLKGKFSLAKAAEMAGITVPEFKEALAARGIIRETEGKEAGEMDRKIGEILG